MVLALYFTALSCFAQTGGIKGRLIDSASNTPVESAKIALSILRDSSWIPVAHALSDENGNFNISPVPRADIIKISITFVSYYSLEKNFALRRRGELDLGIMRIEPKPLIEVQVKDNQSPITIHDDTVAFNATSYETPPNSSAEELMKKLPGIEIDIDGTIYYNGREIKKIRLDGHEFFSDNYRIASKAIDVDMIEEIKVHDDRDEDPDNDVPSYEADKIIDIRLKKAFRNNPFGKAFASGGNKSRFAHGALAVVPHNKLQLSGLFQANNLSNTGLSALSINDDADLSDDNVPPANRNNVPSSINITGNLGIKKSLSGGFNGNIETKSKVKINLSYRYDQTITDYENTTTKQQLANDVGLNATSSTSRLQKNNSHFFNGLLIWRPKSSKLLKYESKFTLVDNANSAETISENLSTSATLISTTGNTSEDKGKNHQFRQNFRYYYRFNGGNSISVTHTLSASPSDASLYNINSLKSFTQKLASTTLNRFTNTDINRSAANLGVKYRHPFNNKLTGFIEIETEYAHNHTDRSTYNFSQKTNAYDSFQQALSNNLTRTEYSQNLTPGITYSFSKKVIAGINGNTELRFVNNRFDRNYGDINQHYVNFLPNGYIRVGKLFLGYRTMFALPNITDMVPYNLVFSQLRTVSGNPNLKPIVGKRLNFRYTTYTSNQITIHTEAVALFEKNSVFRTTTINGVGVSTNVPTNMNGRYVFTANGGISKRFKKNDQFQFTTNTLAFFGKSKGFFEVNDQGAYQNTTSFSLKQILRFNWKKLLELEQSGRLNNLNVTYTGVDYDAVNNTGFDVNTHFTIYVVKYMIIEGNYDHFYNSWVSTGSTKGADVLSLSVSRQLSKNSHNEFRLSCFDIFNENASYARSVNASTVTDTRSVALNRYFLASLLFKFNKTATGNPR